MPWLAKRMRIHTQDTLERIAPKTISHSFGFRPDIDLDKLGQLADGLEAEAAVEGSGGSYGR
jgi:hypothetical protein